MLDITATSLSGTNLYQFVRQHLGSITLQIRFYICILYLFTFIYGTQFSGYLVLVLVVVVSIWKSYITSFSSSQTWVSTPPTCLAGQWQYPINLLWLSGKKILKTEFTLKYDVVRARVRGFVCHNRLQMFTHALNDWEWKEMRGFS